ncbi:hypothetical protein TBLA_0A01560 [Henningerozyma blattae CBS 6284]|uniref:Uncharacterized protein n=1 Tax=Henningerozyma blattae (strain ATCC 34711 / CBS 6284 / DSM 70876 / NBRC 10599 / NRRL Y-10934 / UCD 77-7) TaxID=1071380 RepID=I2GV03_HENB6|nr:hypothetical protein TBLA_0A01560 [Tetrapisispora blattae CBS 6284]CCH57955.1 hypothetical protein TBLA_0A01560 [Tetrapisispora blattae CBS 6284]
MGLQETYIPLTTKSHRIKKLAKLPLASLCDLVYNWFIKFGSINEEITKEALLEDLKILNQTENTKKLLIDYVIEKMWPEGLNLYQLAQIEACTMILKPSSYFWNSSTAWDSNNEKYFIEIEPEKFMTNLQEDIDKLYISTIYIFKHKSLPLIICRIQLFDYNSSFLSSSRGNMKDSRKMDNSPNENNDQSNLKKDDKSKDQESTSLLLGRISEKEYVSRKPFYVAFPMNSPTIIHSCGKDIYSKLIMQCIQRSISTREPITLKQNESIPIKSLENIYILQGASRYSGAMGQWAAYADALFEISPLSSYNQYNASNTIDNHPSIVGKMGLKRTKSQSDSSGRDDYDRKKLRLEMSMLKFKGTKNGYNRIRNFYETIPSAVNDMPRKIKDHLRDEKYYKSLIPCERAKFTIRNTIKETKEEINLQFRFTGNDIFGGLHELVDKKFIDISRVPGWLTGENGVSSGTITDGDFDIDVQKKRGGLI